MARLLLLLGLAAGLFFFFHWLFRQPPRVRWQLIAVLLAVGLLVLVLTGRAHWLAAVFAALLPFVRGLLRLLERYSDSAAQTRAGRHGCCKIKARTE